MLVFVHIPKTAGRSVTSIIQKYHICACIGHEYPSGINVNHLGAIKSKFINCTFFTVVRNPYTRFISAYNYLMNPHGLDQEYTLFLNEHSFEYIIENLEDLKNKIMHFVPQFYFVRGKYVKICKFENLEADLMEISPKFEKIPVEKSGPKFITELTEAQKEIIYQCYREDFEMFGYEK